MTVVVLQMPLRCLKQVQSLYSPTPQPDKESPELPAHGVACQSSSSVSPHFAAENLIDMATLVSDVGLAEVLWFRSAYPYTVQLD